MSLTQQEWHQQRGINATCTEWKVGPVVERFQQSRVKLAAIAELKKIKQEKKSLKKIKFIEQSTIVE